jgi:hypothetical protein
VDAVPEVVIDSRRHIIICEERDRVSRSQFAEDTRKAREFGHGRRTGGAGGQVAFEFAPILEIEGTENVCGIPVAEAIDGFAHWVTPLSWSAIRMARRA